VVFLEESRLLVILHDLHDVGLMASRLVALPVLVANPTTVVALVVPDSFALASGTTLGTSACATLGTSACAASASVRHVALATACRGRRLPLLRSSWRANHYSLVK
jgi:hypothetical protein